MKQKADQKPNRLIHSTSPYLLQHAYNPVDWYEWGPEALGKSKQEDKPILVSIGYSACHWCHVMERESFENDDIAALMNEHFICIKVDREERPDVDQIYMEAVQAMQMNGGWPLNVFLTPNQVPFYGGTYFPAANWAQLLNGISKAFREKRTEIEQSADALKQHLQDTDVKRFARQASMEAFTRDALDQMFGILHARFDHTWGGMEKAPKFVMPSIWQFLLRYFFISKNPEALKMISLTLKKMTAGGLYDTVGGGFARYSVDAHWFAPHFEKMLYDNAQLISLYAEAFSVTKDPEFRQIVQETVSWLESEMQHPEGGVYSALDADSEGVEGKFYTWNWEELTSLLDDPLPDYFGATQEGNWEHGWNILGKPRDGSTFMRDYQLTESDLSHMLKKAKEVLMKARKSRIRPGLDDKVLASWNAMLIQGLTDAYQSLQEEKYLAMAIRIVQFIESRLIRNGKLYRVFKGKASDTEGFLEDYAFLIQAYTSLYQVTFEESWINKAKDWCAYTMENFFDHSEGYFHFVSSKAEKLIAEKKEIFDNVIPSSNAVMARNLYHLGIMLDKEEWSERASTMVASLTNLISSEPGYMSHWGILLTEMTQGLTEVVIVGKEAIAVNKKLHKYFLPCSLTLGAIQNSSLPLFQGREATDERTMIYVCRNKTCQLPTEKVEIAIQQIFE